MSYDRFADVVEKAGPILGEVVSNTPREEKRRERDERVTKAFAPLLSGEIAAATIAYVEACHPDPSRGPGDVGALLGWWRAKTAGRRAEDLGDLRRELESGSDLLTDLALGSFRIEIGFALRNDLFTRDEVRLHPIENAVRRDRALGWPCIAGPSWKGMLRAAWRFHHDAALEQQEIRLFGHVNDDRQDVKTDRSVGRKGRLSVVSTLLSETGFAVINPHSRLTKTGMPIFYETVAPGNQGRMALVYSAEATHDDQGLLEAAEDLEAIGEAILALFSELGLGAKTTIGFGQIEEHLTNSGIELVVLGKPGVEDVSIQAPKGVDLPKYLKAPGTLLDELCNEDGSLNTSYPRDSKPKMKLYEKAKSWWDREGKAEWEKRRSGKGREDSIEKGPDPNVDTQGARRMVQRVALFSVSEIASQCLGAAEMIRGCSEGMSQ